MNLSFTYPNTRLFSYLCLLLKKQNFMMRRLLPLFIFTAAITFLSSCSEKFDIGAPYKNITVVNSLLDMSDTAHYIRIQKAFLDQNKSALVMATVPDSSFYASLIVVVKQLGSGNNVLNTYTLDRVDLNTEGYQKTSGTFFTSPNYAYKFKNSLNPNYTYRVVVTNTASGEVDSSETAILDTSSFVVDQILFNTSYKVSFYSTNPNQYLDFSGSLPSAAAMYQIFIRVHWIDSTSSSGVQKYADWTVTPATAALQNNSFDASQLKIPDLNFFYFLRDNLGIPTAGVARYLQGIDLLVYGGSSALYNYQQLALTAGTGITGQDIEPVYTNIKGKSVFGLFAARGMKGIYNIDFDNATKDSLLLSPSIQAILNGVNIRGFKH
jgi:hypothetical protein